MSHGEDLRVQAHGPLDYTPELGGLLIEGDDLEEWGPGSAEFAEGDERVATGGRAGFFRKVAVTLALLVFTASAGLLWIGDAPVSPIAGNEVARTLSLSEEAEKGQDDGSTEEPVEEKDMASVSAERAEARERRRPRSQIEKHLGAFVLGASQWFKDVHDGAKKHWKEACKGGAAKVFATVMRKSGLYKTLTTEEEVEFRRRFAKGMQAVCQAVDSFNASYWVELARKQLDAARPIMTEHLTKRINTAKLGFKVEMRDWMTKVSKESFKTMLGRAKPDINHPPKHFKMSNKERAGIYELGKYVREKSKQMNCLLTNDCRGVAPASYDVRKNWPHCQQLSSRILNQGACGSCWVFASLFSLDVRMCIASNGTYSGKNAMLSRGYVTSCLTEVVQDGCNGGWEYWVYDHIESLSGFPTDQCSSYFGQGEGVDHFNSVSKAPPCPKSCDRAASPFSLEEDKFRPTGVGRYNFIQNPSSQDLLDVKAELMAKGPVSFGIFVGSVFMGYSTGIYNLGCNKQANHVTVIVGWGEGFLTAVNSWGAEWGQQGAFQMAECVPTDFTIPGDFDQSISRWPLPFPAQQKRTEERVETS